MKKWQTGTLQGVMGHVVGCGVVNVMVYLFINFCTALVVHVQLFMIPADSGYDEIWYAIFFSKGVNYVCT
jgi:hypothetical protein